MTTIDIHIDFACPFSYMGGERFIQFLEEKQLPKETVRFRSFQLQPDDDNQHPNYMMNRFKASGMATIENYKNFFNNGIGTAAAEIGLHYDVEKVISKNSLNAHIGLQYAAEEGKHIEYFRKVMSGHWETGKDYSDMAFIENVLTEIGLDLQIFKEKIAEYQKKVAEDIALAQNRNIYSVPTFYKDRILLQGTGSTDEFNKMLQL